MKSNVGLKYVREKMYVCMYFNLENIVVFLRLLSMVYLKIYFKHLYSFTKTQSLEFFDWLIPGFLGLGTVGNWGQIILEPHGQQHPWPLSTRHLQSGCPQLWQPKTSLDGAKTTPCGEPLTGPPWLNRLSSGIKESSQNWHGEKDVNERPQPPEWAPGRTVLSFGFRPPGLANERHSTFAKGRMIHHWESGKRV